MGRRKKAQSRTSAKPETDLLRGWGKIAGFLKIPVTTVQRWAKTGMPVRREGRFTIASADELLAWLGHEAGMSGSARIAINTTDLATGLKESIAIAKKAAANRRAQKQVKDSSLGKGARRSE